MPLINEGNLCGFIICGQVRAKYQEYKTIVIDEKSQWMSDPEIKAAWERVIVVDNNILTASANLLNFIVNNYEQKDTVDEMVNNPKVSTPQIYFTPGMKRNSWKRYVILMRIYIVSYLLNPWQRMFV